MGVLLDLDDMMDSKVRGRDDEQLMLNVFQHASVGIDQKQQRGYVHGVFLGNQLIEVNRGEDDKTGGFMMRGTMLSRISAMMKRLLAVGYSGSSMMARMALAYFMSGNRVAAADVTGSLSRPLVTWVPWGGNYTIFTTPSDVKIKDIVLYMSASSINEEVNYTADLLDGACRLIRGNLTGCEGLNVIIDGSRVVLMNVLESFQMYLKAVLPGSGLLDWILGVVTVNSGAMTTTSPPELPSCTVPVGMPIAFTFIGILIAIVIAVIYKRTRECKHPAIHPSTSPPALATIGQSHLSGEGAEPQLESVEITPARECKQPAIHPSTSPPAPATIGQSHLSGEGAEQQLESVEITPARNDTEGQTATPGKRQRPAKKHVPMVDIVNSPCCIM